MCSFSSARHEKLGRDWLHTLYEEHQAINVCPRVLLLTNRGFLFAVFYLLTTGCQAIRSPNCGCTEVNLIGE